MTQRGSGLIKDWHMLMTGLLRLGDVAIVAASGVLAYLLRFDTTALAINYQWAITLGVLLTLNYLQLGGLYRPQTLASTSVQVVRVTGIWSLVLITLLALAAATGTIDWYNLDWALLWFGLGLLGMFLVRLFIWWRRVKLRQQGGLKTRIALVGARELGRAVLRQIRSSGGHEIEIIGIYDDLTPLPEELEGVPVRGTVDDLVALTRREPLDEIVIAMVDRSEQEIQSVVAKLREVPVDTKFCAHSLRVNLPVRGFTLLGGLPLLHVYEKPLRGWNGIWKSLEDRVLGLLILIPLLPIMGLIALAIKLNSRGPVLFRQKRYGFNNNEIDVFKFRSMYHDRPPDPTVTQAKRNDPRITRVGAFLRRTSLDELPQLFNVIGGSMSLVGPRPHAVAHNEMYAKIIDGYLSRHRVKPGITGWAQIHGLRGETDTPEKMRRRVQYDLYYIDNWSLALDLKILFLTVFVGFVNENAY